MGINITLFKWNGNIVPANLKDRTHKLIQKFTAHIALFTKDQKRFTRNITVTMIINIYRIR